ncbi:MAG TPA: response regulator [Fimbriimonadaceae bacterium]|nr:response regulator [Fimbriimonadaceae bacterium]
MSRATILITDDALFMRTMLKNILMAGKFRIIEAGNGTEAVDQYKAHRPDMVFMDITMPGMDGIAATKAIRQIDPNAVVVMCSAMGQQTMVVEAVRAGAKDFIVKPVKPDRVLDCIKKFCPEQAA